MRWNVQFRAPSPLGPPPPSLLSPRPTFPLTRGRPSCRCLGIRGGGLSLPIRPPVLSTHECQALPGPRAQPVGWGQARLEQDDEGVFNFGELLMHPVLESLRGTDRQWLIDTLYAFNSGNVEQFQTLKAAWGQQPDLAANEAQLLRKIQLLCLMEMTFTRPANHRQLTFEEIAKSSKISVNEVELLVMKALSVGLVKGSIDEVDGRVHMTWVQPRVLDLQQIQGMKDRLESWCTDVKSMEMLVEHQAHDVLT